MIFFILDDQVQTVKSFINNNFEADTIYLATRKEIRCDRKIYLNNTFCIV